MFPGYKKHFLLPDHVFFVSSCFSHRHQYCDVRQEVSDSDTAPVVMFHGSRENLLPPPQRLKIWIFPPHQPLYTFSLAPTNCKSGANDSSSKFQGEHISFSLHRQREIKDEGCREGTFQWFLLSIINYQPDRFSRKWLWKGSPILFISVH